MAPGFLFPWLPREYERIQGFVADISPDSYRLVSEVVIRWIARELLAGGMTLLGARKVSLWMKKAGLWLMRMCSLTRTCQTFSPLFPYYPLSSCQTFLPLISVPTGFLDWGLVTTWAQLLINSLTATYPAHWKTEVRWGQSWQLALWARIDILIFCFVSDISPSVLEMLNEEKMATAAKGLKDSVLPHFRQFKMGVQLWINRVLVPHGCKWTTNCTATLMYLHALWLSLDVGNRSASSPSILP